MRQGIQFGPFFNQPKRGSCTPCLVRHSIHPANSHQGKVVYRHEAEEVVLVAVGVHWSDFRKSEAVVRPLYERSRVQPSRDRQPQGVVVGVTRVFVVRPHESGPEARSRIAAGI